MTKLFCLIFFITIPVLSLSKSTEESLKEYTSDVTYSTFSNENQKIKEFFILKNPPENADHLEDEQEIKLPSKLPFNIIASKKIIYPPRNSFKKHKILKGDTYYSIANKFNISVNSITKLNHSDQKNLQIGAVIKIPVKLKAKTPKEIIYKKVFIYPVENAKMTSSYGRRRNPFNRFNSHFHAGIDLAGSVGTPAIAAADGVVDFAGRNGGYGNTVILEHKNGIKTIYAHLSRIKVKIGEKIRMGDVIGAVGRTGIATAAHLHFAVLKNGKFINPVIILQQTTKLIRELPTPKLARL